jgi:hypothetical protein
MADILLSNDDLTVFGGPENISLDLDIGPQGDRGSIIIGTLGDPRDATVASYIVQDVQALDLAIDANPNSPTFKTLFQYVVQGSGSLQWTPVVSLKTEFYSSIKTVTAANGKLVIPPINVTDIYLFQENSTVDSSNFSIQYSISSTESSGPLSTNLVVKELNTGPGFLALPLEINGVEYINNEWVPMTGTKSVHLFITVV